MRETPTRTDAARIATRIATIAALAFMAAAVYLISGQAGG